MSINIGPEFEREMRQWRGWLPTAPSEKLVETFEGATWGMAQLEVLAREAASWGITPDPKNAHVLDPSFGEQYRLLAFAAKQELLKRLGVRHG